MLGVEFSPRSSGMSSRPDLQPHPPPVLPVDALAPRPKQPHLYSRARARPGQTVELSSRTIEAASVASLSATVQSIEGRVASVRALRATSPMTRVLQSQHSPAPTQRQRRSNQPGGKLPPMGRGKEDDEPVAEPVESDAEMASGDVEGARESVEESAVRLGVLRGSGLSIPDMHGLKRLAKSDASLRDSRRSAPDSALASSWLDEVVSYGLAEIGDPNKGLTQEFEGMGVSQDSSGVARLGVAHEQLRNAGLAEQDIDRLYRALYVYSVGFHEMVQQVVGTGQQSARAVVNVLRTFNFVSEVIQRTSFTNNLVSVMLENESNTARIAALQAEIADLKAHQDDKNTELELQGKMYDDAVTELHRSSQDKKAVEVQLESVQALMDALSLPGGEIYRLKLLLEEAQTSKHEIVMQARQHIGELEAALRDEKAHRQRLQEAFQQYRDETTADIERKEKYWALEKKEKDDKIRWLGNELDRLSVELDARNKQIPELEQKVETATQDARVQQKALKEVIDDLRKDVKDVKKQAIEDVRVALEEKRVAVLEKEAAVTRGDSLDAELKTTKSSLEETQVHNEKLTGDLAEISSAYTATKTALGETESKLSLERATCKGLRQESEDLRTELADRTEKLEQEVQDWKRKEAQTKEKGDQKLQREKDNSAKKIASKDEQLDKLRDTVKNNKLQIQELKDQKVRMKQEWEQEVETLEATVAKLERTVEARDATIEVLKDDKAGLEATVKKLNKEIEKLKSKAKKDLAAQKEDYDGQITVLSMQINKLKKTIGEVEKDKASVTAALKSQVKEFMDARDMVVNNMQSFSEQLGVKEKQLEEESLRKISHQQAQIKQLADTVKHVERYRQNLVRQRESLRQNLIRNANELQLAQDETESVRAEVENLKLEIQKLEKYLRRYRERFQSTDVGCQAGLDVVMADTVEKIEQLTMQVQDGDSDGGSKPLEMMQLAMQLVEVLEESASLPRGSVSRFFRIAIDEFDIYEDRVRQEMANTNMRYGTAQKENAAISGKWGGAKKELLDTEKKLSALSAQKTELAAEIQRGPPELATLAQAADDAKEDAAKWQKLYEAAATSFVSVAQSAAQRIRSRDLSGAQDYQKLLLQCDANTPITQELLSGVEAEASANAEQTALELISAAEDVIEQAKEKGINVNVAEKAMEELGTLQASVAALTKEKDVLACRVQELGNEHAAFVEAVASANHDPYDMTGHDPGVPSAQFPAAPTRSLSVIMHPVGVYASWHERDPRAAHVWSYATSLIDQVPDLKPMSVHAVQAAIIGVYMDKVHAELIKGKQPSNLCDFTVRTFEDRYGLADLAEPKLLSFVAGLRKHRQATLRIKLFSQFCRLDPSDKNATAINRGAQAQEYFLNVLHSLHGFMGRDQVAKGPFQTVDKLGVATGSLGSTAGASDDFGWATRWLASDHASLSVSDNAHASKELGDAADSDTGRRVMVPLDIVRTVGASIFAAEAPAIMPKILQYIEVAHGQTAYGSDQAATAAAVSISGAPVADGSRSADLDAVLMAFMRVWEEGIVRRLASMQGLFVTSGGRGIQQAVPFGRDLGEAKAMLTAHSWNPAVAVLSTAVCTASDAMEAGHTESEREIAGHQVRQLTKTLQSTNLLLSKTIQLLARQQEGSTAWSAYQLLMDGLQTVARTAGAVS